MLLALVILTSLIITFGRGNASHPPCIFNPLCTCSRSDSHLGVVTCAEIPLMKLPLQLNRSKLSSLRLINNGLRKIDSYFLSGTGLHQLKISNNPLYDMEQDALKGLEGSLRDIELSYAELIQVPSDALRPIQKLQILNLSGNFISDVSGINWINIRNTLEILILCENSISHVPSGAFERFTKLKSLDLSHNVIFEIDADAFDADMAKLTHLYLSHNQLHHIPYAQLRSSKALKVLDLNYNYVEKINSVPDAIGMSFNTKFSLYSLHLEYNNIRSLSMEDFEKFSFINTTYFKGNEIISIQPNTFEGISISGLSLASCGLVELNWQMLRGLEGSLITLDLSNNNFSTLDPNLLRYFLTLRELKTLGNTIGGFTIPDRNSNLLRLEVGGTAHSNWRILLRDISKINSLIGVTISNVEIPYLEPQHFFGYGFGVEEMKIVNAKMESIYSQAFVHVRGLKTLDLSNNQLSDIDETAFAEIGHALNSLYLSHAFATSVKTLPHTPLKRLKSLKFLDISYNSFEELPATSFHSMYHIESIRIHDCQISILKSETFQSEMHGRLKEVTFSFNQLRIIKSYTFNDLPELRYLNFEENLIQIIETRAFNNLNKLKWLYLRGNQIEFIHVDAFSSLPELEILDLAFNNLKNFDLMSLDEMVGSLSFLNLNLSFNGIHQLQKSSSDMADVDMEIPNLNIKILDLSHNIISSIGIDYFTPLENSLTHLLLSHNLLLNANQSVFGSLYQLQWLDLSSNKIHTIQPDIFRDTDKIQVLSLRNNKLYNIPSNMFHRMKNLRLVDLSNNLLTSLPEYSFREDSLESISLAQNQFGRIPFKSFIPLVATSLREMDLSFNSISSFHAPEFMSHLKSLLSLNVSGNGITILERNTFASLTSLVSLDLSHNYLLQLSNEYQTFDGLQRNLRFLGLTNTSMSAVPHLPFEKLLMLHLSDNNLTTILPEVVNLTSVRVLDLSRNNFTSVPVVILSMKNLKLLNLSRNNIHILSNSSLLSGFNELRELDISDMPLKIFEAGALSGLSSLQTVHMSTYGGVYNLKFPKILEKNNALQNLFIHVSGRTLDAEMTGRFPKTLRRIAIYGSQLEDIDSHISSGFSSPQLSLTFEGTKIQTLSREIFQNMQAVRNISIDVRNNAMMYFHNPSTDSSLGLHNHIFLVNLKISQNIWTCKCDIGWVETWNRVRRQLLCRHLDFAISKRHHLCLQADDDLRLTRCEENRFLLRVMKSDLECQWNRSSRIIIISYWFFLLLALLWSFKIIS